MVTGMTALGIAVAGVIGAGTLVVSGPLTGPAHADGLKAFDSCAQLRNWYVDKAAGEVGPYGWDSGPMYAMDTATSGVARNDALSMKGAPVPQAATVGSSASASSGQANSATGTNTQEVGVDEPDVAKTNGRIVVRVDDQNTLVVTDVTGSQPREVGRLRMPQDFFGGELLLIGHHVLVLSAGNGFVHPMVAVPGPAVGGESAGVAMPDYVPFAQGTRVIDIDISDPAAPRIAHTDTYSGTLLSARSYGNEIRLVTSTSRPQLNWVFPGLHVTDRQATARNRELVQDTTVADWLPSVTVGGRRQSLTGCDQVMHPQAWSGDGTVAVTTFAADDVETRSSVAITADSGVVYSSTDRLYLASSRFAPPTPEPKPMMGRMMMPAMLPVTTDLHAFALDGPRTTYVGSGSVRGILRDRWSLDSHDGVLRVAWTRQAANGSSKNGITTLQEKGGALVRVGEIGDLGINEQIQSVRWFDNLAVVVTFRQMDPLYTIDLTDPAHPREIGALTIPGYSGYLHPIGDHKLLGLGVEAAPPGQNGNEPLGSQVGVFDLADLGHPRRVSHESLGPQTSLPAIGDPRMFTWLPDASAALTTLTNWSGRSSLLELKVSPTGDLSVHELPGIIQGWNTRVLPLAGGRVAVVDQGVRLLRIS